MRKLPIYISLLLLLTCAKEDNTSLIEGYQLQISQLNSKITEYSNQVTQLQSTVNSLNSQINTIPGLENTITSLNEQIGELEDTIATLTSEASVIPDLNDEITSLEETIASLNEQIEELEEVLYPKLPTSINREDLLVDNAQAAPIQKYFNFNSSFYSQVHYDLNTDADIIEMQFDGSYTPLKLTERVFGEPQDSLNGLTFDVDKNKTKLLANFWGEGDYGSWFRPNILALFDLQLNTHEIIIDNRNTNNSTFYTIKLFDLDSDGKLDIYLAENGYILSTDKNKIHQTNTGPGPVFIFDLDSDGIDDLIHFNTVNNSWIKFKGGTNLNKTQIISDYSFRNYIDDYTITDYDLDGDLDLIFLDAETDPTNNNCTLCKGKITLLENQNGNLVDVTNQKFDTSTYPQMLGDNNILIYDFDFDGDDDLFFPDWYYQDGQEFNNYYWENKNGYFTKIKRTDLD